MSFYFLAAQYQQSWAYANNVNLLAANVNLPAMKCSGSGIYAGRLGALRVFVSESAATKILIAQVPIDPPSNAIDEIYSPKTNEIINEKRIKMRSISNQQPDSNANNIYNTPFQDDLTEFTVEFLNLAENPSQDGVVCNKAVCCNYSIEVSDSGEVKGKVRKSLFKLTKRHNCKFPIFFHCTSHRILMQYQCSVDIVNTKLSKIYAPVRKYAV